MTPSAEHREGTFFGMDRAAELAIAKWGRDARCWYDHDAPPESRCRVGTGGVGRSHVVHGQADNWLDAARNAGLL